MSVKIGESRSDPRPVPGGSPQGSIMGNYLFCITTNDLTQNVDYGVAPEISFESLSEGASFVQSEVPVNIDNEDSEEVGTNYNDSALDETFDSSDCSKGWSLTPTNRMTVYSIHRPRLIASLGYQIIGPIKTLMCSSTLTTQML